MVRKRRTTMMGMMSSKLLRGEEGYSEDVEVVEEEGDTGEGEMG